MVLNRRHPAVQVHGIAPCLYDDDVYIVIGEVTMSPTKRELLDRISVDPRVCFGKPCIRGHRIWVSLVLDLLADGMSEEEIVNNYPGITMLDVRACIAYGAEMSRERYVDIVGVS